MNAHESSPARIFLVEDHALMRYAYRHLLGREPDLAVCGEATRADDALAAIARERPDLAIVDLRLDGGTDGLELVRQLRQRHPEVAVVVVSMNDEGIYGERAIRAGARAYVAKSGTERQIVEAVRAALAGRTYYSPGVLDRMLRGRLASSTPEGSPLHALSDREIEVFEHFGRGHSAREIAELLGLERKTVDTYRRRIKQKLGIERSAELIQRAVLWVHEGE